MMAEANILGHPRREAALLATVNGESFFEYNIREINDTRNYGGRGFIQLTGDFNYGPCGKWLGIDLLAKPNRAQDLDVSWRCLLWYWTIARPRCNEWADKLQMGKINAAIGYPFGDGSADAARCRNFGLALAHLTGNTPAGINCDRKAV
jgi:putative chitinase